jgi:hypothetical protein
MFGWVPDGHAVNYALWRGGPVMPLPNRRRLFVLPADIRRADLLLARASPARDPVLPVVPAKNPVPSVVPAPPARQVTLSPRPPPSWPSVLATTVRLWAGRRLGRTRWRVAAACVLAVMLFAAGAITIGLTRGTPRGLSGQSEGTSLRPGSGVLSAVSAARRQAAVWVAQQVSTDMVVACDPAMCAALQAARVPVGRLLVLRPGTADPLGSDIVIATAAVRGQFGTQLERVYAPVVLATFGSGTARIEIRVVAPDGAAAYLAALAADVRARKVAGAQLLHNSRIHFSSVARGPLVAGQVDARLLVALAALATLHPLAVMRFTGPAAHGATAALPLRAAEIEGAAAASGQRPASLQALRAFLSAQHPPYRPSDFTLVAIAPRLSVLRIEYPAPSPLGLLGSHI